MPQEGLSINQILLEYSLTECALRDVDYRIIVLRLVIGFVPGIRNPFVIHDVFILIFTGCQGECDFPFIVFLLQEVLVFVPVIECASDAD